MQECFPSASQYPQHQEILGQRCTSDPGSCSAHRILLTLCTSELPVCQIMKLQRVQNAAARLVLGIPRCEHRTPCLRSLHWLPVEKRIVFKLCLLVSCLQDPALFGSIVSVWFASSICTSQTIEVGKSQPYGCAPSTDADIWESPLPCCCFSAVESASRLHQEAREHGGFQRFA